MTVKVVRKTGIIGMASKINLKINGQSFAKLKNNEIMEVPVTDQSIKLSANQLFIGSQELEVTSGQTVELKINTNAIVLYIVSLMLIFCGATTHFLIISIFGLLLCIAACVYFFKNFFVLEIAENDKLS